ncbi:MAG: YegS/Rv2252/BmrU family lipid kinase [Clostridia bacterium]|jgi:YegS/Rv2252/BmrU family lipid kinase|nr:YegS/Rv2252/BmrU family lipid kinase [Clostridia bacterium]
MKYIFIVNPESAKGNAMKIIGNIEKVCKQEHIEYEVCYTLAQGDATRLAQSYKDDENIIYAVGGDGTLSEVLNGVVGTKNKIGIIPAGSGNDFYRTVKELAKAEIESDVGVVNGKYFLNIACVGIDAEVANNVPLMKKKNVKVKNLYTASILYTFTHFKFKQIHFKSQEKDEKGNFTILSICNGRYYGGGYNISPKASLEDNYFDVYYINKLRLPSIINLLLKLKKGKLEQDKRTNHFKTNNITVTSEEPIRFNVDGETIENTKFEIKIIPKAIKIYHNAELESKFLSV